MSGHGGVLHNLHCWQLLLRICLGARCVHLHSRLLFSSWSGFELCRFCGVMYYLHWWQLLCRGCRSACCMHLHFRILLVCWCSYSVRWNIRKLRGLWCW